MQATQIVTFSHLRWKFVHQRPQHLLSALAEHYPVFFIEEPVAGTSSGPEWEFSEPSRNVVVCRPHTPCLAAGFHNEQSPYLKPLIRELVKNERLTQPILWFYTPMALALADEFSPVATVYDCMDELSAFLGAPVELRQREQELLAKVDLVFTGGMSLYRAKKDRHPHVYCFPSSVDAKHFACAANGMTDAVDQAGLPHPRLGFYGVIDERIDLALIDAIAAVHPEWQIIIVGPVVKIDAETLPRRQNIHYFGQRSYSELPSFLKGWDVCLMPFARNPSTEFISPTKTLEYMAAEKMIVSTPITDVAKPYGEIVYLGGTAEEFIVACERALTAGNGERAERKRRMREVVRNSSWTSTVHQMKELIDGVVVSRTRRAQTHDGGARTVIVGAGPTGLSAAYHLGADSVLLEQNANAGGWCRSIEVAGFTFDYAGHIMFSDDPYVLQLYNMLLGDNLHWQNREAWIYSHNVYTRYPFQGCLYGLPPEVIKECIVGAIEARFGPVNPQKETRSVNGHANGANGCNGNHKPSIKDCCADGILESSEALVERNQIANTSTEPRNFEEFIFKVWGAGIAKHFAVPYNRKLWAVPLTEMETSWLGGRVPLPDLEQMIEGALSPVPAPMGPNARFGYPLRGGFQALMNAWLPHLTSELRLNTRVAQVLPSRRKVILADGTVLDYEYLISTMPLPLLIRQIGSEAPARIRAAAARLRHVSVRCVHLGIGRERLTEKHWIYYPEDTVFHRIFVQGNASPHCNPPGGFGLTCEITYSDSKPLPCDGDQLVRRCIEDCHRVGMFSPEDPVLATAQCDLPGAYVVYDHHRADAVREIRSWLAEHNIILAGRYSEWEYYNSDHAFLAGKRAAEEVRKLQNETAGLPLLSGRAELEPFSAG